MGSQKKVIRARSPSNAYFPAVACFFCSFNAAIRSLLSSFLLAISAAFSSFDIVDMLGVLGVAGGGEGEDTGVACRLIDLIAFGSEGTALTGLGFGREVERLG